MNNPPRLGSTLEPVGSCAVCFLLACRFRQGSTAGLNRESERFTVLVAHRVDELDFGVLFMTDSRPQMSKVGVGPAENLQPVALLLDIDTRFPCSIQYYEELRSCHAWDLFVRSKVLFLGAWCVLP